MTRTVSNLPTDGRTLYVRLWTHLGRWDYNDYSFKAAAGGPSNAQMASPAPGSTLTSSTVTFTWTGAAGAAEYWLYVGTTFGGRQIYSGSQGTALSRVVSGIPRDGRTIHVLLWTRRGSTWNYNAYTYATK